MPRKAVRADVRTSSELVEDSGEFDSSSAKASRLKRMRLAAQPMALFETDMRIAIEIFGPNAPPKVLDSWLLATGFLEQRHHFPKKDILFGNRRYWRAVRAFLDGYNDLEGKRQGYPPDGKENWDALR